MEGQHRQPGVDERRAHVEVVEEEIVFDWMIVMFLGHQDLPFHLQDSLLVKNSRWCHKHFPENKIK